jgi:Tol biopolymer transport system component
VPGGFGGFVEVPMSDQAPSGTERCPQCDAEFVPAASPLGLCPACLLKLGVSDPAMKPLPPAPEPAVSSGVVSSPPAPSRPAWRRRLVRIGAPAAVVVALLAWALVRRSVDAVPSSVSSVIRFSLPWPDDTDAVEGAQFAVSPDGSRVALAARHPDGQTRLWMRTLQSMEWRDLPRTDGAALPFWSPDSRQIAFFADKKLKKIDVSNGLTQMLSDAPSGRGGTWGRQDTIVFAPSAFGPLVSVSASGGTPRPVTTVDETGAERGHAWPHFLPDGRTVLFVVSGGGDRGDAAHSGGAGQPGLHLVSLDSGHRRLLLTGTGAGIFAQGFLLFVRRSELLAQRFDPVRAEFEGEPRSISGAELVGDATKGGDFAASDTGVLVHRVGGLTPSQLTWLDRNGRALGAMSDIAEYQQFSISPDARRVVVARRDGRDAMSNLWLLELDRQITSRLTSGPSYDSSPVWLPDGNRIAFVSRRDSRDAVYSIEADGGGKEQLLHNTREAEHLEDLSPDGRFLVYSTMSVHTGSDLWFVPVPGDHKNGDHKPQPLFQTAFNESQGRLSPDGRWIAYVSDESGRDEVYVRPFPMADSRWQISTAGGQRPRWRRDGRELFFLSPEGHLQVVDVQADAPFRSGRPRALFPMRHAEDYDVSADGRFLTRTRIEDRDRGGLQIVLNWSKELRRER